MNKLISLKSLLEREDKAINNYNASVRILNEENEYFENNREEYAKNGLKDAFEKAHIKTIKTYNEDIEESLKEVKEVRKEIKKYFEGLD